MNSDFMQIEAEELAEAGGCEPDNRARIRKVLSQLTYGRDPAESEVKLGLDYLKSEPLKEYEETRTSLRPGWRGKGRSKRGGAAAPAKRVAPAGSGAAGRTAHRPLAN
jgi:hypothetical protein